jgi:ABC-2 type transport system permease protein
LKQYLSFFKLKFTIGLQYRAAALAGLSTQLFFGLVFIFIYSSFYKSGTASAGMTLSELITYLWLNQAFFAMIFVYHKDNEIINMIKKGDIAYELCRPQNLYFMWFIRIISSKLSSVVLRCLPIIVIALLMPSPYNLSLPFSLPSFLLFIIILFISAFLISALITLMYIICFYTIDTKGTMSIFCGIADILSGQTVPIPLFPNVLKIIAELLPFAYVSDFAFRVYSGNIRGLQIIKGLSIELFWLITIITLGLFLSNRIIKKVSVQGG